MEIACPNCGQRLNVRAGLRNPTCRCPGCNHIFRAVECGYDPLGVAPQPPPEEPGWSFDRPTERPPMSSPPVKSFEALDEPSPTVIRPRPNPPKTPNKAGIGTLIFVVVIVVKILSKFLNHGPPAQDHRPRNDLRPSIPVRRMQTMFERLPREVRVACGADLRQNATSDPE